MSERKNTCNGSRHELLNCDEPEWEHQQKHPMNEKDMIFENSSELIFKLVSPHSLEKYDVIEKGKINRNIPERDGIYFLYDINDTLLYLSGSANIRNKVKNHMNMNQHRAFIKIPPNEITKIAFVTISKLQIRNLAESLYLLYYKPKYNVTHFSAAKLVILS